MDIDPKRLSAALQVLYAATVEPHVRSSLSEKMAEVFQATSCLMHTAGPGLKGVTIVGATPNIKALMPTYASYHHSRDQWAERVARRGVRGRALLGDEMIPDRELVSADWYQDLCKPHDIHYIVGSAFDLDSKTRGQIGVHRSRDGTPFDENDREMMALLIPHLKQAYRLMRIVDRGARAANLTFEALGELGLGVIVISAGNRVRSMNDLADQLLARTSAIFVRNGRLSLADPKLDNSLRRAAWSVSLAPLGQSLAAGETIMVRIGEAQTLTLMAVPLPLGARPGPIEPLAVILIGQQESSLRLSSDAIRALYGLTPAEARLVLALLWGHSLADYAASADLCIDTVRSQIKSVLAKTKTHRQADLVSKLLSNPVLRLAK